MSDAADAPLFPPEEICAQAQGNAAAWILTMIAYLKERGGAVEKTARKPSPVVLTTLPSLAPITARRISSWRARASDIAPW